MVKPFDPKDLHKLNVRLPTDEGPNPYDSKTGFQPPEHLTLKWWIFIICGGLALFLTRHWLG